MPAKRSKSSGARVAANRTPIVWTVFIGAMAAVTGLLALNDAQAPAGFLLTSVDVVGAKPGGESIFTLDQPLDRQRWTGIVIHHLGEPAGDAESIHRQHLSMGYQGLGYHFLIGNGNGLGDGVVHVGYRWDRQQPGAHVLGRSEVAAQHNQHSIAICLVGNGDRRPFTDQQMARLTNLVQRLQAQLNIPGEQVRLHRELVPHTTSPGKFFAAAQFREQLLD